MNWALGRLMSRGNSTSPGEEGTSTQVDKLDANAESIGRVADLKKATEEVEKRSTPEDDSRMEE